MTTVIFFAQYPKDFALSAGLAALIKETASDVEVRLVYAKEPNSADYDWSGLTAGFDAIDEIPSAMYGPYRRLDARGFIAASTKAMPAARRTRAALARLDVPPDSVAFAFDGFALSQTIFLRSMREREARTVLIAEYGDSAQLSNFTYALGESAYMNLVNRRVGAAEVDMYWMRTTASGRTSQREYRFRAAPADLTFAGAHGVLGDSLAPGHAFWPYYRAPDPGRSGVLLLGGMFHWEPLIGLEAFFRRYNELIDIIRKRHEGERLVYLAHPSAQHERHEEADRLNLDGFERLTGISAEALASRDPLATVYAVVSTGLMSTVNLGLRAHCLYRLFDDTAIPPELKRRYDARWSSPSEPGLVLSSEAGWLAGDFDYDPHAHVQRVHEASVDLLRLAGVVPGSHTIVSPEDRWEMMPRGNAPRGALGSALGVQSLASLLRRVLSAPWRRLSG